MKQNPSWQAGATSDSQNLSLWQAGATSGSQNLSLWKAGATSDSQNLSLWQAGAPQAVKTFPCIIVFTAPATSLPSDISVQSTHSTPFV
jgi:hypothetical protein